MPAFGTRTVDRTQDLLLVRQMLIPAELYGYVMRVHLRYLSVRFARVGIEGFDYLRKIEENLLVDHTGIEPAISCLQGTRHPIAPSGPYLAHIALAILRLNLTHKSHQDAKQGCF